MLNHVMIGCNDVEKSKGFYTSVLGELGAGEPATVANGSTIGFACESPEQIKQLHDVAVANGGTSIEDAPGLRESNMGAIHLCYFTDPDGHKMCGFHRAA